MNLLFLPLLASVAAAPPPARPARLGLCAACHGEDGRSRQPDAPHLGGQVQAYLARALAQYRDGSRPDPVMRAIAGTLDARDIEALAAWYAQQPWPAAPATER